MRWRKQIFISKSIASMLSIICLCSTCCTDEKQIHNDTWNNNRHKNDLNIFGSQNSKNNNVKQKKRRVPTKTEIACYNGYGEDERIEAGWSDSSIYLKFAFKNTKNGRPVVTKFAYRTFKNEKLYKLFTGKYKVDVHLYDAIKEALGKDFFDKIYRKPLILEKVWLLKCDTVKSFSKDEYDKWILENYGRVKILDV